RQDVEEIGVVDAEAAVQRIHAVQSGATALAVVATLEEGTDNQVGVVVALLRAVDELAGVIQQTGNAGHGEGAEQGELQGAGEVEGELVAAAETDDLLMIPLRIERLNLPQPLQTAHLVPLTSLPVPGPSRRSGSRRRSDQVEETASSWMGRGLTSSPIT